MGVLANSEFFDGTQLMRLPLDQVIPNPDQPRTDFSEEALTELAESLRRHGVIQPVAVTRRDDKWMIVAGERRWRAAALAELETVPAVEVACDDDRELLEFALVENLQREDLNPIEEARAYNALIKKFSLSQDEVAIAVGKARSTVTNAMRLLRLSIEVQQDVSEGRISAGHARAVLSLPDRGRQHELRDAIIKNSLNVRQAEQKAAMMLTRTREEDLKTDEAKTVKAIDPNIAQLRDKIAERTACRVDMQPKSPTAGTITLHYTSLDELDRILETLGVETESL